MDERPYAEPLSAVRPPWCMEEGGRGWGLCNVLLPSDTQNNKHTGLGEKCKMWEIQFNMANQNHNINTRTLVL